MADILILLVVAVILVFALRGSRKHFKGESSCCGGGSEMIDKTHHKKKKLNGPVLGTKTMEISGMHCDNCARNVTEAINSIDGAIAKVNLKKGTAEVSYDRELDDNALRTAVEQAGYQVVSITA